MTENSPGKPRALMSLPEELKRHLRSGIALSSMTQCVEELVFNAIDAQSTCIAVRVDLSLFKVEVFDNGIGISSEDMKRIGSRYITNKFHSLDELGSFHGFRGEALASLRHISSLLQITSRSSKSDQTIVGLFVKGKRKSVEKACKSREVNGSTVIVNDIFYNFPVRRKYFNLTLEIEDIKRIMFSIALSHPSISFTLRNEITGEKLLQSFPKSKIQESFVDLHSEIEEKHLKKCSHEQNDYKLHGFISTEGYRTKNCQYVFVNRRLVNKSHLLKQVNAEFKILRSQKMYPAFVLFFDCPWKEVDFTFEPRKTEVVFKKPQEITTIIQQTISKFLKSNSLTAINTSILTTTQPSPSTSWTPHHQASKSKKVIKKDTPETVVKKQMMAFYPNMTGIEPLKRENEKKKSNPIDGFQDARVGLKVRKKTYYVDNTGSIAPNPMIACKIPNENSNKSLRLLRQNSGFVQKISPILNNRITIPRNDKSKAGGNSSISEKSVKTTTTHVSETITNSSFEALSLHGTTSNTLSSFEFRTSFEEKKFDLVQNYNNGEVEAMTMGISSVPTHILDQFQLQSVDPFVDECSMGLETARQFLINAQEVKTKWKKRREYYDTRSRSGSDKTTSGTENNTNSREMNFMTSISSNENERLVSLASNEQNERCSLINSTPVDVACIEADALLHNHTQCTSILNKYSTQETLEPPQAQDNNIPNDDFEILPECHQMDMDVVEQEQDLVNMELENPENALEMLETNTDDVTWIEPKPVRKLNFHSAKTKKDAEEDQNTNQIDPIIPQIEGSIQSSRVRRKNKASNLPPGSTPYLKKTKIRVANASETDVSTTTTGFTWNNPILERPQNLEIDWRSNSLWKTSLKLENEDINQLTSKNFIGQVDLKFVAATLKRNDQNYLLLFDQHAMHERIRVEKSIAKNFPNGQEVLSVTLETPIILEDLNSEEVRILDSYKDKVSRFGLTLELLEDGITMKCIQIPKCFKERDDCDKYFKRPSPILNLISDLAKELVNIWSQTKGGLNILPRSIANVLNSQACRGAIMFNDPLDRDECLDMIRELKNCKIPFQCAHGRPSVAPIVDLTKLKLPKKTLKLDLSKLKT